MYQVGVHAKCLCNELKSLTNRHLVDRTYITFNAKLWRRIALETNRLFYGQPLTPVTYTDVINSYSGVKKALYTKALHKFLAYGWKQHYKNVKMFVKPDRYPLDDCSDKDPRAIQYRDPVFNLNMSKYIKAFEHHYYRELTMGGASQTRVIAKGLNPYDRAAVLLEKERAFDNPVFVLVDHSRFDSTINVHHLRTTHKKYQKSFQSRYLQGFLTSQLKNTCYSFGGIKYRTTGTRMSGDPDTGCGNTVVNLDCLWGFLKLSGVTKYDIFVDGDDSIIFIEQHDLPLLNFSLFRQLGFDTKYEIVDDIRKAEFCQSRLVRAHKPVMVRNPIRAMSHAQYSKKKKPLHVYQQWLAAVGECELASNQGVPILQAFGQQLSSISKTKYWEDKELWRMANLPAYEARRITPQARLDFEVAWGVSIQIQLDFERRNYTSHSFRLDRQYIKSIQVLSSQDLLLSKKPGSLAFSRGRPILNSRYRILHGLAFAALSRATAVAKSLDTRSGGSWWCGSSGGAPLLS